MFKEEKICKEYVFETKFTVSHSFFSSGEGKKGCENKYYRDNSFGYPREEECRQLRDPGLDGLLREYENKAGQEAASKWFDILRIRIKRHIAKKIGSAQISYMVTCDCLTKFVKSNQVIIYREDPVFDQYDRIEVVLKFDI